MDFKSLSENSPVHVVRKKPFIYEIGTLKSKGVQQQMNPYLAQFMQQQQQQTLNIVVNVGGKDEPVAGIPTNGEVVEYNNAYYCTSVEGAMQAIATMMQIASTGKAEQPYYDDVLAKGEQYMEQLNPQYAEGKRQARTVRELQERQDEQDKKMDKALELLQKILAGNTQGLETAKK